MPGAHLHQNASKQVKYRDLPVSQHVQSAAYAICMPSILPVPLLQVHLRFSNGVLHCWSFSGHIYNSEHAQCNFQNGKDALSIVVNMRNS